MSQAAYLFTVQINKLSSAEKNRLNVKLTDRLRDLMLDPNGLSDQELADLICELRIVSRPLSSLLLPVASLLPAGAKCSAVTVTGCLDRTSVAGAAVAGCAVAGI